MNQTLQNSYLQRYELKQSSREGHSLNKSAHKQSPTQPEQLSAHQVPAFVSKMSQRIDGIEVKLTSITNVVKLLQKYTETRDQQYEKEKENQMVKKISDGGCSNQCSGQIELKIRQFDVLNKQFRQQMRAIQKMKGNLILAEIKSEKPTERSSNHAIVELQQKLRDQINKKMDICIKLINSGTPERGITEKINQLAFGLNQLQNQIKRNRMMFEKDIDRINALIKENSTVPNNYSRLLENDLASKSPDRHLAKSKSKNSKSDKSLSKGKQQNRSVNLIHLPKQATKVKDEQLREALRKKKQHRQRLKVKNW